MAAPGPAGSAGRINGGPVRERRNGSVGDASRCTATRPDHGPEAC
ncbi:hypothetical protein KPATCC21470_5837 [Kitasatospora purpeofusca]